MTPSAPTATTPSLGIVPAVAPLRVGAVNYLNSKPLIHDFARLAPGHRLSCDLPSRLADAMAAGALDVALEPVFEVLRTPGQRLVSDACVAADGPVASVKLYFRTPPDAVQTIALDEGSRTSAALARVLLWRRCGLRPATEPLPLGHGLADVGADAVLVIGDRAMHPPAPAQGARLVAEWDLAEEWRRDTGLPFVFAAWAAREGVETTGLALALERCRDAGLANLPGIAALEAPRLGLRVDHAERYLRTNLRFVLGPRERAGLDAFAAECVAAGLLAAPTDFTADLTAP
ncbi:MAG: menaquinone biosynthetic enzyme MqnA/MqnD family protein [Lacipirellulaceae bacterium]